MNNPVRNIRCDKAAGTLTIIDQTLLPNEEREIRLETAQDVYDAIKLLRVRGAPAIGICAAYGLYVTALDLPEEEEAFWKGLEELAAYLNSSRPTAVNLSWAIRSMLDTARAHRAPGPDGGAGGIVCAGRGPSRKRTSPCAPPSPATAPAS